MTGRSTGKNHRDEFRNHSAVLALRILPRSKYIEVTQHNGLNHQSPAGRPDNKTSAANFAAAYGDSGADGSVSRLDTKDGITIGRAGRS